MNEKLNLVEILKDCPKGTKLYSSILGDAVFENIHAGAEYPIVVSAIDGSTESFAEDGRLLKGYNGECTLFPSREQRDWSKFKAPWMKEGKFDPKTLKPYEPVLAMDLGVDVDLGWSCNLFSHYDSEAVCPCVCVGDASFDACIPFNDETKHLLGTFDEPSDYYHYWED